MPCGCNVLVVVGWAGWGGWSKALQLCMICNIKPALFTRQSCTMILCQAFLWRSEVITGVRALGFALFHCYMTCCVAFFPRLATSEGSKVTNVSGHLVVANRKHKTKGKTLCSQQRKGTLTTGDFLHLFDVNLWSLVHSRSCCVMRGCDLHFWWSHFSLNLSDYLNFSCYISPSFPTFAFQKCPANLPGHFASVHWFLGG